MQLSRLYVQHAAVVTDSGLTPVDQYLLYSTGYRNRASTHRVDRTANAGPEVKTRHLAGFVSADAAISVHDVIWYTWPGCDALTADGKWPAGFAMINLLTGLGHFTDQSGSLH